MKLPKHLAIIMDGNGRWAKARGHNRFFGHVRGAKTAKSIIEECARLKIEHLTLFTFSTENWLRPPAEIDFLMSLLARKLRRERALLMQQNIRFCMIGDLRKLPGEVRHEVTRTIDETSENTGMVLTFAISYGGRQDIVDMTKAIAEKVARGEMSADQIDEHLVSEHLATSFLPDPDLIVRTSGELRISNFFLWQAAYSEIFFEEVTWPEFTINHLHDALRVYAGSERRFGRTGEQLQVL